MNIQKILETNGSVGVEANETQEMYKWKPKGETNNVIDNYLSNYGTNQQSKKSLQRQMNLHLQNENILYFFKTTYLCMFSGLQIKKNVDTSLYIFLFQFPSFTLLLSYFKLEKKMTMVNQDKWEKRLVVITWIQRLAM